MSATPLTLADHIRNRARAIDDTKVSVTKWNPIRDLLAEAAGTDSNDLYVTTVSKPGNLGVRLEQSARAREATVVVIMYTGEDDELERCVEAARKRASRRDMMLVFADDQKGDKYLAAIVKPAAVAIPTDIATAYPSAIVVAS
jgi:hypothetical protein